MESTPGKDTVKIVEMTTKNWEYYINWVNKAEVGFERLVSKFGRSSTMSKMLSNSIGAAEKSFLKEVNEVANFTGVSF